MPRTIHRASTVLAAALLAAGTVTSSPAFAAADTGNPAAGGTAAVQSFAADSGDNCKYGYTEGRLEFRPVTAPPSQGVVVVGGTLTDRPVPFDPGVPCRDDSRYSSATFSAYSRDVLVAEQAYRVDNDVTKFEFRLQAGLVPGAIDRVVVQVCRTTLGNNPIPTPGPTYCGTAQTYLPDPRQPLGIQR
ncbi:hypothetical protein [Plantactinospora soyae]|uniref:Secreted protein n=1 Tax=Plantactinospora soyae TaxID=1544732 RepID=A0A927M5S5_9ACTN|nr:hypothetical protein [Plantactinospora soyae]MBE1488688.1 hypothetical protein [Plantactinospora soyae]